MEMFFATLGFFAAFFVLMAVGAIFNGKVLKGSCGGIGKVLGGGACLFCSKRDECKKG